MGKIIKFLLTAILCLFLLGMVMGLVEQFGGVLIAIAAIGAVVVVVGKNLQINHLSPIWRLSRSRRSP